MPMQRGFYELQIQTSWVLAAFIATMFREEKTWLPPLMTQPIHGRKLKAESNLRIVELYYLVNTIKVWLMNV